MMKSFRFLSLSVLGLAVAVTLHSQTQVDLRTQSRNVDFSGADSTKPAKSGTTPPSTCVVGELFFKTDAPAGENLYACTSANVWTLMSGGTGPVDSVFGRTGAVTAATGDYNADQVDNTPAGGIGATNVQAAINELDGEKAAASHTHAAGEIDDGGVAATQALFSGGAGSAAFRAVTDADVPNSITIDLAATAGSLAANPADCAVGEFATAIDALGNLTCATPAGGGDVTGPVSNSDNFVPQWDGVNTKQLKNGVAIGSVNTANALVQRDGSGNFSAGTITAALSGNASTSTALAANPTDCSGGQFATAIDASGNLTCATPTGGGDVIGPATNSDNFVPQWNGVNSKTLKNGLNATNSNDPNTLVQRNSSGNFAAGTITAALNGNASTAAALSANPANCSGNQFPKGIQASGVAEGCTLLIDADIPSAITRDSEVNIQGTANEISSSGTGPAPTLSIPSAFDISGKTSTAPIKKGTTLPATCAVGQYFMDTDAVAGLNTYACTATNNWTLQGDGGGAESCTPTNFHDNETPSGTIDGVNDTFTLAAAPDPPESLELTLNGILQVPGTDYTLSSATITFADPPESGDFPRASYREDQAGECTALKTGVECWSFFDLNNDLPATLDVPSIYMATKFAFTIDEVTCETDVASGATINLQRDDGSPANILSSNLTCSTTAASSTSFTAGENSISAGHEIDHVTVSAASGLRRLNVCFDYTKQ